MQFLEISIIIVLLIGGILNMAKKSKDYFGLPWIVSVLLALFLGPLMGILTRISEKKFVAAIVRLLLGWNILWLIDFILVLIGKPILRLINV